MFILLAVAGFVMLIAIIWCVRLMRNGYTTLATDKKRWHEHFREEELKLNREQQEISAQEHMHILDAAIEDLLRLENKKNARIEHTDTAIVVHIDENETYTLSMKTRSQTLHSIHKTLHSPRRWLLTTKDGTEEFQRIDDLMRVFCLRLRGEYLEETRV